jgi:hypothetical protein
MCGQKDFPRERFGSSALIKKLKISEVVLRRRVERLRKTVAKSYEERLGLAISADAVIQTKRWHGYRMNPMVRIVAPDQIAGGRHEIRRECHDSSP